MRTLELANHFIRAVEAGDVDTARACFHPDAEIWHNYDGATQSVDENMRLLEWMTGACESQHYDLHRLEEISVGYLQQHTLRVVLADGRELSTEAIAVVFVVDGKIARIEEYLDPAPLAPLAEH